jgi:phosphonate ABC transporter permease subunit PhnE
LVWLGVIVGVIVFAYGFEQTEVDLDEIQDETRRVGLVRILRDLASPEILEQDVEETATDVPISIPCGSEDSSAVNDGPQIVLDPPCADPRATIVVMGTGFAPTTEVGVFLIPESQVELRLAQVRTDADGAFSTEVRLPNRPSEAPQTLRVLSAAPVGPLRWTDTAYDTLDKIIETIFLALIATTFATLLAVPLSFFAARNLMEDIKSSAINISLSLIALPLGVIAGVVAASLMSRIAQAMGGGQPLLALVVLLLTLAIGWLIIRRAIPAEETEQPLRGQRIQRASLLVLVFLLVLLGLYLAANLAQELGGWLTPRLGAFDFLGRFLATIGELISVGLVVISAIFGAGVLVMTFNRFGHGLRRRVPSNSLNAITIPLAMLAGAIWATLSARAIAWFYEWTDLARTLWIPLVVGAIVGLWVAWRARGRPTVRLGRGIYYITRTVFNVLRAIEPLIMAIVFVVWVGIGPFAGALALALHTIAALAKLYSEQVESISAGPLEAVRATGANRLQNVVYAVVPQIVPPYISFTMYRWDINVRMSTIIGFVGGGGIGFLLQQNINLLEYRQAAAQILAIAVVVAAMDWLSSRIRARYV